MKKLIKFSSPLVLVFLCALSLALLPGKLVNSPLTAKIKVKTIIPKPMPILYFEAGSYEFSGVGATSGHLSFVAYDGGGTKITSGGATGTFSSSGGVYTIEASGSYVVNGETYNFNIGGPAEESTTPFF